MILSFIMLLNNRELKNGQGQLKGSKHFDEVGVYYTIIFPDKGNYSMLLVHSSTDT
jgi:hypothetical protein